MNFKAYSKNKKTIIFTVLIVMCITLFYFYDRNDKHLSGDEKMWLKRQDTIVYAANENAPPLRFVDNIDNQYKGVVVDYINQLSLELGVDIQTVPMKWDEALSALKEGTTQICDMFISDERAKYYLFTEPIYNLRTVLMTQSYQSSDLININNMTIATERGDYANGYLTENYPGAKLVYTGNVEEGFELFLKGEVDAVIGDEPIITYLLVERNANNDPRYSNIILYQKEVVLGVSKNRPELVPILNKAIRQINGKGQLEKIQQKWFGISTPLLDSKSRDDIVESVVVTALIASCIFVLILLNNFSLQQQVRKRTGELENSRNELQIIFDGISEFMLVADCDKNVLKINKSFADYLGILKNSVDGSNCTDYLGRFCHDCSDCMLNDALECGYDIKKETSVGNEVYEMNFQSLEGTSMTVLVSIKNITLDKINRNQMLQSNKMIAVGQLAAGMAHEIRNPLGIIRTQSYLVRINDKADEAARKSLDFIDTAVERASKIIDNILNFSRLSSNSTNAVDMNQVISKLIEIHDDIIKKKNIKITVNSSIRQEIFINAESIEHIILNLLSNSIDAIVYDGEVNISIYIENEVLTIICKDSGTGIDEKHLGDIFNPFFTTKELGKGTGLGLFIVYSEVEKLRGKIEVNSKLGEGAEFVIRLPLERKSVSDGFI